MVPKLRLTMFLFWLCLSCLPSSVLPGPVQGSKDTLYDPTEPILQLKAKTFDSAIYGQPRGFFVEFYSSWCGGCIHYAPTWKAIAQDAQLWQSVLQVTVVNCAMEENTELCRIHEVDMFPTLKVRIFHAL